jgi:hypothetical protein
MIILTGGVLLTAISSIVLSFIVRIALSSWRALALRA